MPVYTLELTADADTKEVHITSDLAGEEILISACCLANNVDLIIKNMCVSDVEVVAFVQFNGGTKAEPDSISIGDAQCTV